MEHVKKVEIVNRADYPEPEEVVIYYLNEGVQENHVQEDMKLLGIGIGAKY